MAQALPPIQGLQPNTIFLFFFSEDIQDGHPDNYEIDEKCQWRETDALL